VLGLDWDIMYVGHCWDIHSDTNFSNIRFIDPNTPSRSEISKSYQGEIKLYSYKVNDDTHQRLIINMGYLVCTIAYALTQKGRRETSLEHRRI
jgi:hypothetical protein